MNIPWLTIVTFLPLIFGLVVLLPGMNSKAIRTIAMIGTIVTLIVSGVIAANYHGFVYTPGAVPQATDSLVPTVCTSC